MGLCILHLQCREVNLPQCTAVRRLRRQPRALACHAHCCTLYGAPQLAWTGISLTPRLQLLTRSFASSRIEELLDNL